MIIDDTKLLEQLLGAENVNFPDGSFDKLDLSNQDILNELAKIKRIDISFFPRDDIENTINQLCNLIAYCPNLEFVRISSANNLDSKKFSINKLIDVLVKHNVKQVSISDFNYDYLSLCTKLLSSDNETIVRLDKINDPISDFSYIFGEKKLREKLKFTNHSNKELEDLYNQLNFGRISLKDYEKYKDFLINYENLYVSIGNVSDLDLNKLESIKNDNHIKGIHIRCGYNNSVQYYSIEEYENIRKVIDNIVRMIKLPKIDDPNRDKLIFAQIYKILGKNIRYDHYAISDEGEKDEILSYNCRNLKNGLLGVNRNGKKEFLTVCAGYATILQNLCACFNIKCDYISSHSKEIVTPGVLHLGSTKYENGTTDPKGHAYNAVYLDGQPYLCDLTWDANQMKLDGLAQHFLKSYEDFCESHKDEGFSSDNVEITTQSGEVKRSLDPKSFDCFYPIEKQTELFGMVAKGNIDEMISEGYLADFASKNIEYIKQVKGKVGMSDYLSLIKSVRSLEKYMQSLKFKEDASKGEAIGEIRKITDDNGNVLGEKCFSFYPGSSDLPVDDAIAEVNEMEERQWKMR